MRRLAWTEFDAAVEAIAAIARAECYGGVFGFPRGGLCLAVALSHRLGLPLISEPRAGSLIVDDVYESGRTLNQVRNLPESKAIVWVSKAEPTWFEAIEVVQSPDWLIFPWEDPAAAVSDEASYRASHQ